MSTFMVMAGGTGGHIFPALAVANVLRDQGHEVVWLGSAGAMESKIVPQYHIELKEIPIKGIRGNGLLRKLTLPFTLIKTIWIAKKFIQEKKVSAVIGFGGFVSFPGGVAAKLSGVPLIIHEQNAIAGLSNKVLAKFANKVFYAFPNTFTDRSGLIGNPVRQEIIDLPNPKQRFEHRTGALKLLVVGGSLGAKIFNETLPQAMALLDKADRPIIVHQCGRNNHGEVAKRYADLDVDAKSVEFIQDMSKAYAIADFVICRSGALTVSELSVVGLGGILIPFPYAVDDHQTANAQYLVNKNAAICIPQNEISAQFLALQIKQLNRQNCLQWAENAQKNAFIDAAEQVAKVAVLLQKSY